MPMASRSPLVFWGGQALKCSKRSFAVVSVLFALLLSLSAGTLNARDADLASHTFAAAQTAKQKCINTCRARYRDCRRREPVAIVRVSGCLPGLHPIHLYWFRTRMTDVPFAAAGFAGASAAQEIQRASASVGCPFIWLTSLPFGLGKMASILARSSPALARAIHQCRDGATL